MTRPRTAAPKSTYRPKEPERRTLTHERLAGDIAAFQSAGGHIEVLGTTRVLKKLEPAEETAAAPPAAGRQS